MPPRSHIGWRNKDRLAAGHKVAPVPGAITRAPLLNARLGDPDKPPDAQEATNAQNPEQDQTPAHHVGLLLNDALAHVAPYVRRISTTRPLTP